MAKRRRRGVVLTPEGLQKFQDARLKSEAEHNYGERYTYEKLSDITYLDIHTIKRVIECQEGVDKRTLERLFISFEMELTESCYTKPNPHKRQNWGEAMCVANFFGRTEELSTLESWLLKDRCRIITILAMGGMGKTCLSVKLAKQVQDRYDLVMWCSLRDAPPVEEVVCGFIEFFSDEKETALDLPASLKGKITKLIEYLRNLRCLLVLDNIESLLCEGKRAGEFREGYEGYGELLRRLGDTNHQSNVIITTREKPKQIAVIEGEDLPVRNFRLYGLAEEAGEQILQIKGLAGSESAFRALVHHYGGNALALKVVATTIKDLFAGDIHEFLEQETAVFGDIRDLLKQQFDRLTDIEREIVYWLAINREPLSIDDVQEDMVHKVPKLKLLEGLESLSRRSLIEQDDSCYTLQNVVMEYVICRFIERVCQEIISLELELFRYHAVIKATAKDYIRETQIRLIMEPILDELMTYFKSKKNIEKRLREILTLLRENFSSESCYAAGNILNMLCHMKTDFTGYDFSNLTVWQADFRNSCFHDVNLANADLSRSVFAETFGGVSAVALSPNGKLLATGDSNAEVRLYSIADAQQLSNFLGHTNWITSITFSPDGNVLASSSADYAIKLWNVDTGECITTLQGHSNEIWSAVFSPNGNLIASGSDDHTIRLWDVQTGECIKVFQGHTNWVLSVVFSPDGLMLISGSDDHTIRLWDVQTGECIKVFQGHEQGIRSVACSPCGEILASGSDDHTIRLWDVQTGECIKVFQGHQNRIWAIDFNPQGDTIASGSHDHTIRLWDVQTGGCIKVFQGHSNWIFSLAFSSKGDILASGSRDQTVKLWKINTGKCLRTMQGHSNLVFSVALSSNGQNLASGSHDQKIRLWDISNGHVLKTLYGHSNWIYSVSFNPQGNYLLSGSGDQTVKLWDISTGQVLKTFRGHSAAVRSVVFCSYEDLLASGSEDETIKLWDISTGLNLKTFEGHSAAVWSIACNPQGSTIASGSWDRTVKLWNVNTGECLKTLEGHDSWVYAVCFSSDGNLLASASSDQTIKLWCMNTGKCIKELQTNTGWLQSISFSPDNKMLASSSHNHIVKIWNIHTGKCIKELQGHTGWIWSVFFNPDNQTLVSGSEDETIKVWNIKTGDCIKSLKTHKLYERMNIMGVLGLTNSTIGTLKVLGAND